MDTPDHNSSRTTPSPLWGFAAAAIGALSLAHAWRLPLAEAAVAIAAVVWMVRDRGSVLRAEGSIVAAAACALMGLSLARAQNASAVAQVAQLTFLLVLAPPVIRTVARRHPGMLSLGISLAWGVSVVTALLQRFVVEDARAVGGLAGSRALYGILIAAGAPYALTLVDTWARAGRHRAWRLAPAATFLVAASTILHLPSLVLACLATAAWTFLSAPRGRRVVMIAAVAVVIPAAALMPGRWGEHLVESVITVDADGIPRRGTLEHAASTAAIADRPLLGHGPGEWQRVVSSAEYRHDLGETAENRAELNTQGAYRVLAVEHGFVAAALVLALFVVAAVRSAMYDRASGEASYSRDLTIAQVTFGVGMIWIHPLVIGAGTMASLLLGLSRARLPSPGHMHRIRRAVWAHVLLVTLATGLGLLLRDGGQMSHTHADRPLSGTGQLVVVDASSAFPLPPFLRRIDEPRASLGAAVVVPKADRRMLVSSAGARYDFELAQGGTFQLWVRSNWQDGCGNSVAVAFDGGPARLVGNDGTYGVFHWVRGYVQTLGAGRHVMTLYPRERGAVVDQLVLTDDDGLHPTGIIAAPRALAPAPADRPADTAPPVPTSAEPPAVTSAPPRDGPLARWISEGRGERDEFLGAVGGAYRGGPESFFVMLGIPYHRLREDQLSDPKVLARYDVVWLAAPQAAVDKVWNAIDAYVTGGGTAILEKMGERYRWYRATKHELRLLGNTRMRDTARHNLSVAGGGSKLFAGTPDDTRIPNDIWCWSHVAQGDHVESHGVLRRGGNNLGAVLTKRRIGTGTVYALMVPVGFAALWRGRDFDALGQNILVDAVAGRYAPLYAGFRHRPRPGGAVHFADDFMREPGQGKEWRAETGRFRLTGSRPRDPVEAFSLSAEGDSLASAGNPNWERYRVAAAVEAPEGGGGVWLTTRAGHRLSATYDGSTGEVTLTRLGEKPAQLASASASAPHSGWRRVSLMCRGDRWEAWLDGRMVVDAAADGDEACGRFGVLATKGRALFDDVSVRDVSALVPERDVAPGEDGSPRARAPLSVGLEPRTIYAPQWLMRPDPRGRHAFVVPLPTYAEALLEMDGVALGAVPARQRESLVYLPDGRNVTRELSVSCPAWRDYTFGNRPVEWYATGSAWTQLPRWSCDPRWSWLGTDTTKQGLFWHRPELTPPYTFYCLAAPSTNSRTKRDEGRDLFMILGGNGRDATEGAMISVQRRGRPGIALLRGGERLAQNEKTGLPTGHALHHRWFELIAQVDRRRVRFWYEGELALDVELDEDLPRGRVAFMTRNNCVRIARALIAGGGE